MSLYEQFQDALNRLRLMANDFTDGSDHRFEQQLARCREIKTLIVAREYAL